MKDPKAKVLCPSCNKNNLGIIDIPAEKKEEFERHMICDLCEIDNRFRITLPK